MKRPNRSSGILLHPTSLPGRYGIGGFGHEAIRFLDFLAESGQTVWQVLPLGPIGSGNSPYQAYSAFAGNPLLISTDLLVEEKLLDRGHLTRAPEFPPNRVDYPKVTEFKSCLLREAFKRFRPDSGFEEFRKREQGWLEDYALYMAIRRDQDGKPWNEWPTELVHRKPSALREATSKLREEIEYVRFEQYLFNTQYKAVRKAAEERGIRIMGDLPIFVSHDSADVWADQGQFYLDPHGNSTVVAGVPPDYFSATGQLWGNPLYRWDVMAEDGYSWWTRRMKKSLELFDLVRVDHFRGFEAYWEVLAGEETAINGRWVKGPGEDLFRELRRDLGKLPVVAEDLGLITPEVEKLRDKLRFPGMKVIQFAFSGPDNPYLPHNHTQNCVVYTGTHDNDTTAGWWRGAKRREKRFARDYLGRRPSNISWDAIRLAMGSVSETAIVPLQDVLGLGSEARMNTPGTDTGNWEWRFEASDLTDQTARNLLTLTKTYGRCTPE